MSRFALNLLPESYQSLKDASILIVGNGPSAGTHNVGSEIDTFDFIVRINNFAVGGHEENVGSRTDIWVNGANQGLSKRSDFPDKILVMIPPVVLKHKGDAIHKRIQKRLGTNDYVLLPESVMSEMETSCGLDRPTTGFFTIYFFYLLGLNVTLHGFDFFVGSTAHYFDSPVKRWLKEKGWIKKAGKHDVSGEKAFIENLIQSGDVKRLRG